MDKTVCELFAGVGGFRCGLNHIEEVTDASKPEKWKTVWFSQWEPAEKKTQWAYSCYLNHFGPCPDINGNFTNNNDINSVDKTTVPDHNLLVGGFPCQDYSVASTLITSKGLEGKKGVLWWDIRDMLEAKRPSFVLLENVDRLLKSPARQRGRDFGVILACFRDLGYIVEWRVINAAEYGYQQRRRRVFIFAYRDDTKYAKKLSENEYDVILKDGFFASCFAVKSEPAILSKIALPKNLGNVSSKFSFDFKNSGFMKNGIVYTMATEPDYNGRQITLGDIMETGEVDSEYFIPENRLYWTDPSVTRSDESEKPLSKEEKQTWQYIKGGKRLPRKASNGHEYMYSEGPVPMVDESDKPARTMLTGEGSFNRSTHIVRDKSTGKIRLLTAIETERIQGFPSDWTKECLVDGKIVEMPLTKRRFMMGNALVVNLISQMEPYLSKIIEEE
mgnify:CR=1 FL=1